MLPSPYYTYIRRCGGTMSHAYTVPGVNTHVVVVSIVAGRPTTIIMIMSDISQRAN